MKRIDSLTSLRKTSRNQDWVQGRGDGLTSMYRQYPKLVRKEGKDTEREKTRVAGKKVRYLEHLRKWVKLQETRVQRQKQSSTVFAEVAMRRAKTQGWKKG